MSFKEFDQSVRDATRHLLETPPQPYETVEEHVQDMISSGYWSENLTPIKCKCGSTKIEDKNQYYENHFIVEYQVVCSDCGMVLGHMVIGEYYKGGYVNGKM